MEEIYIKQLASIKKIRDLWCGAFTDSQTAMREISAIIDTDFKKISDIKFYDGKGNTVCSLDEAVIEFKKEG